MLALAGTTVLGQMQCSVMHQQAHSIEGVRPQAPTPEPKETAE